LYLFQEVDLIETVGKKLVVEQVAYWVYYHSIIYVWKGDIFKCVQSLQ